MEQIIKKDGPKSFLLNNYRSNNNKIYFCSPFTFSNIIELEKERAKREEYNVFLIHFYFKYGKSNKNAVNKKIQSIFEISLRKSDIITWISPEHLTLLLVNIKEVDVNGIIHRIKNNIDNSSISNILKLTYEIEKITKPITN